MIKKFADHKKEMAYLIGAIVLALVIITYLFILVHSLVQKALTVFGSGVPAASGTHYDFTKAKQLLPAPALIPTSSSTSKTPASSSTSTPATEIAPSIH